MKFVKRKCSNDIVKTHPTLMAVSSSESFSRRVRRVFVQWFFKRRGVYSKHIPLHAFLTVLIYFCNCQRQATRLHERNIIVPVDKKRPCYCIFCYCVFVTLLQLNGNYVFSDAINIITLITTRKHYDTYHIFEEFSVFIIENGCAEPYSFSFYTVMYVLDRYICC